MTVCKGCGRAIGVHEDPHTFGAVDRYHPSCCPMCAPGLQPSKAQLSMVKRGHRRGTPRARALRGVGS